MERFTNSSKGNRHGSACNTELAALITGHEERITILRDRNLVLAGQFAQFEADLIEAQANCEAVPAEGLYYLHTDHLGRPQFATDPSGLLFGTWAAM